MTTKVPACSNVSALMGGVDEKLENEQLGKQWFATLTCWQKGTVLCSVARSIATNSFEKMGPGLAVGSEIPPTIHVNKGQQTGEYFEDWIALAELGRQRPAVLNFGSCSWPMFRMAQREFEDFGVQYKDKADFYYIYIEEAHAKFQSINGEMNTPKSTNIEERIKKARFWHSKTRAEVPLLVDNSEDEANLTFGAEPERFCILQGSKIAWQSDEPRTYSVNMTKIALNEILSAA
eukprot:gnl/MRDRNA2_/MRDRNA2_18283_c0_seq1.p1 gnl/MRDRNA2_/MRDRNA2_18283_c0~~gnl/MRDRNA2_/MRDRNA2_18283_c0_seq1.p1  ORF type:complete len:234 (+),score=53.51 gnl/MRDRNA2_/MRDRNA2_18283_c0_seq1:91-792(+)